MDSLQETFLAGGLVALVVFILAGVFCFGGNQGRKEMQDEAIKRGFAQYNPTNAVFEWKK